MLYSKSLYVVYFVYESESVSCSVMSSSLRPHVLYCPWNFPGKNSGVDSHSLQGIFPTQGLNRGLLSCRQLFYEPPGKPSLYLHPVLLIRSSPLPVHIVLFLLYTCVWFLHCHNQHVAVIFQSAFLLTLFLKRFPYCRIVIIFIPLNGYIIYWVVIPQFSIFYLDIQQLENGSF